VATSDREAIANDVFTWVCNNFDGVKAAACPSTEIMAPKKLQIQLNIESLCPDSVNAVVQSFAPAIQDGRLLEMADVTFNIAGKAKAVENKKYPGFYNFTCQNGPGECFLNQAENCIQKYVTEPKTQLMSIVCMFDQTRTDFKKHDEAMNVCSEAYQWTDKLKTIRHCINHEGSTLHYEAIQRTPKAFTYVPWPAVQGMILTDADRQAINQDVLKWVCSRTYKKSKECPLHTGNLGDYGNENSKRMLIE